MEVMQASEMALEKSVEFTNSTGYFSKIGPFFKMTIT